MQSPEYLRTVHYRDSSRLNARAALWKRYSTSKGINAANWLFERASDMPNADLLDVGCGDGRLWADNVERIPARWNVTLSDVSAGMIKESRSNLEDSGRLFSFLVAEAASIPTGDSSFDVVMANYMLYHVPDVDAALAEIKRVLRSGGTFIASTNSTDHIKEVRDLQQRFGPDVSAAGSIGRLSSFSMESGQAALQRHFNDVKKFNDEEVLSVDDAEAVISYVLSLDGEFDEPSLRQFVEQKVGADGSFPITRSTGFFVARNSK